MFTDDRVPDALQWNGNEGSEYELDAGWVHKLCHGWEYTSDEKYALESFKINTTGNLLKPFSYEEFKKAVDKAHKQVELEAHALPILEANSQFLFLKSEYKIRYINFNEILYVEGLTDYIKVFYCWRRQTHSVAQFH